MGERIRSVNMSLTNEQKDYVSSSINENIYLEACPGSGKTEVIAAKAAKEISNWKRNPAGIAFITFTNSATAVLKNRISKSIPNKVSIHPHFIGTFDSFIQKFIVQPFGCKINQKPRRKHDHALNLVTRDSPLYIRTKYPIAHTKIQANHYDYNASTGRYIFDTGERSRDQLIANEALAPYQLDDLRQAKNVLWRNGLATYRDMELIAALVLANKSAAYVPQCLASRFPLIIIDECQDLSIEQLNILQVFVSHGSNVHLIGDLQQAIYGFRHCDPNDVVEFIERNAIKTMALTENFRSNQEIVNVCSKLINKAPPIGRIDGTVNPCEILEYFSCPSEVIGTFNDMTRQYKDRSIIARGHGTLSRLKPTIKDAAKAEKLAYSLMAYDPGDINRLQLSLKLFSECLREYLIESETVKPDSFNCPSSIRSTIKWRNFLARCLHHLSQSDLMEFSITWSDWCRKAKFEMKGLLSKLSPSEDISTILQPLNNFAVASPSGKKSEFVGSMTPIQGEACSKYRICTIHEVKGETHEATMLVSSQAPSMGSHWTEWISNFASEDARIAYVACSRPKHKLIWAIKKVKTHDKKILQDLGFKFRTLVAATT